MNEISRLKDSVRIKEVVDYLGIDVKKRGGCFFIPCPNPKHNDNVHTNCYFKDNWNNVYCAACHYSATAVDLIMDYNGMDYGSACDELWNIAGKPGWYYKNNMSKEKTFWLTRTEAKKLGIKLPNQIYTPISVSSCHTVGLTKARERIESNDSFVLEAPQTVVWQDFISEEDMAYRVYNSAKSFTTKIAEYCEKENLALSTFDADLKFLSEIKKRAGDFIFKKGA